jgi:hypothetical protein
MELDSPKWTTKIWTSIVNYGLHQMVLPVEVHILEFVPIAILNYGLNAIAILILHSNRHSTILFPYGSYYYIITHLNIANKKRVIMLIYPSHPSVTHSVSPFFSLF